MISCGLRWLIENRVAGLERKTDGDSNGELSIVIPISERYEDIAKIYQNYEQSLGKAGYRYHFYYVLDGEYPDVANALQRLISDGEPITIVQLARYFGEATALAAGFSASRSERILTLPPYLQIEADEIPKLIRELQHCDVAVARRMRDQDTVFNRLQSNLFNWTARTLTGEPFHDLGCGAKALRRPVADELQLYGDQHRFFGLLAKHRGFKVREIPCQQAVSDRRSRPYRPGIYIRRMLDLLTVFFLVKFTKKPLRFFGLVGSVIFTSGAVLMVVLLIQRLGFGIALGDRPILLLATLLAVLGVQIVAIGLIGEIIIFTHAKDMKEYKIEFIVRGSEIKHKTASGSVPDADSASDGR